jgi:hypothetical protein
MLESTSIAEIHRPSDSLKPELGGRLRKSADTTEPSAVAPDAGINFDTGESRICDSLNTKVDSSIRRSRARFCIESELADWVQRIIRAMNLIHTLSIAMGASWVSGISLYASVAMLGLLSRFAHLELPGELRVLTNWWVIGIAVTLYVVEFIADKIPVVDSVWDVVHTFIRIPAGAVLAATAFGDFDKPVQVIAFLLGGGLAFSSHGTKAATRAIVNTSPEPVSNIVVSLTEDVIAIVAMLAAVFLPFLLFAVVAAGLVVSAIILPKIFKFFRQVFRSVRSFFSPAPSSA